MGFVELRDYNNWIGKTPEEIINAVAKIRGGWATVFPGDLPLFAHQVRNLFNVEPISLTLYDSDHGDEFVARVHERFKNWGRIDKLKGIWALSGAVYRDQSNRTWFQMGPGAAIYHWGGDPGGSCQLISPAAGKSPACDAGYSQFVRLQSGIPIFKLISPDGTGGSVETIIRNPQGRFTIGEVNKPERVSGLIVPVYRHQGSYNYSETVEAGLPAHERHDVAPHQKYPDYYINPQDRFSLARRRFRAHRPDGKLIGYEKGMEPYEFDHTRPDPPRHHDAFANQMLPPHYPLNDRRSLELAKSLEWLFRKFDWPKRLLARIEVRRDKAAIDFHNPKIIPPDTARRLLKILKDRPPEMKR